MKTTTKSLTRKPRRLAGALLLTAVLAGCETTGLSPRESGRASYSHLVYQMARQQTSTATPLPLRKPVRLAVAQVGEVAPPTNMLVHLRNHPDLIASVMTLPLPGEAPNPYERRRPEERTFDPETTAHRLAELGTLARSLGADQVLVFGGSIDTRTSRNALAPLDVTLVGMTVFPSTDVHAEGKAAGLLIDVASGAIRFQVETEQKEDGRTPSCFTFEKTNTVRVKVRDALAASLAAEFIRKLRES